MTAPTAEIVPALASPHPHGGMLLGLVLPRWPTRS